MSVYVIAQGGFMGGWAYRQVAKFIQAAGHEVYTPTLTGYGERAHLASPEIDLNTHIQDIVGVLECEDLQQVILVGHSSGSMVITGVAERVPERLSRLVYVDTIIPKNGQSWLDLFSPEIKKQLLDLAKQKGDGWRLPMVNNPPRWQPQPLKTISEPLEIKNPAAARIPRAYIHCTDRSKPSPVSFGMPFVERAAEEAKQKGWWYRTLPTGHGLNFTMPKEFADLLLELA
jgi:pimeloyl-ACP methyl ester carboxylesterase